MIAVCMPAYNESESLRLFLPEILSAVSRVLPKEEVLIVVVNDCSTDSTIEDIRAMGESKILLLNNKTNLGHGPSLVIGLKKALLLSANPVVSVDGDGQFSGEDIAKLIYKHINSNSDITEGVRQRTGEPLYRKLASLITKLIVIIKTKSLVRDANTPLRVYKYDVLKRLIALLPPMSMVPNLHFACNSRILNLVIEEGDVFFGKRRSLDERSVSWGNSARIIPSRKFVKFCFGAGIEILNLSRKHGRTYD